MTAFLTYLQIISAVLLVISILVQNRGTGLSATFGGSDTFFSVKRGAEKVVAIATVVFAVIFVSSSALINFI